MFSNCFESLGLLLLCLAKNSKSICAYLIVSSHCILLSSYSKHLLYQSLDMAAANLGIDKPF